MSSFSDDDDTLVIQEQELDFEAMDTDEKNDIGDRGGHKITLRHSPASSRKVEGATGTGKRLPLTSSGQRNKFNKNTKTIISQYSLKVEKEQKEKEILKLRAQIKAKDQYIKELEIQNQEIPLLKKNVSALEDKIELMNKLSNQQRSSVRGVRSRLNQSARSALPLASRIGNRGEEENDDHEIGNNNRHKNIKRRIEAPEDEDYDDEFQPLPDDLVLCEVTEDGPKPARSSKFKRITF
eukprot:TRINITY_DN12038_c0_g1_i1.p1 TRINITY_DN12038_c0_g1~~TRINITY_DN12038_c0_g1_i1.p1  ORF type:complete len:238 (+),score=53.96 TRINITY_DN12038_c0_g1_i1:43-756(+)